MMFINVAFLLFWIFLAGRYFVKAVKETNPILREINFLWSSIALLWVLMNANSIWG